MPANGAAREPTCQPRGRDAHITVTAPRPGSGGPPHAPTLKDIAAAAGVSQGTVSRVLNDVAGAIPVSEATRRRVRTGAGP
jgi:AraC-like DNA-binding protein